MNRVRVWAVFDLTILLMAPLSGCLSNDEDETDTNNFEWPGQGQPECEPLEVDVSCREYLTGFTTPVTSLHHPVNEEVWFADLDGRIVSWDGVDKRQVANLTGLISNCHTEAGLLGFTFTDDFQTSSEILFTFIGSANCETKEVTNLFLATGEVKNGTISMDDVHVLREIEQPYRNHNGGHVHSLGNHSYLWGIGDGGGSNDPMDNGQNGSSMLGTIQHFWYNGGNISPLHNTSQTDDDYVLHKGLRNPWKFDVDPQQRLWIADVGQNCFEEVNMVDVLVPTNFGWAEREANREFSNPNDCSTPPSSPPQGMTDPILVYAHEEGRCSITGGLWMDWGPTEWQDGYLYGDFCSGDIWLAQLNEEGEWVQKDLVSTQNFVVGFGRGLNDELLIFTWTGTIFHLDPYQT